MKVKAESDLSYKPQWSIFFDFHTPVECPDIGKNFDTEEFADYVKECGVDYIVFPARCNMGRAYYNTKAGIRHPNLKYDLLKKLTDSCKKKNIKISTYINAGLSHAEAIDHMDWLTLNPDGFVYRPQKLNHFFRTMCYNTGYQAHLLKMVKEVVTNYEIAGLFFDCMGYRPCVCPVCIKEMKQRGMDWSDPARQMEFARFSTLRIAKAIKNTVESIKPNLLLYFNGVEFEDQKELGTYFEYECLPSGGWGYELLPIFARYLRNLGKHTINMTGRFHRSWGDFGGIRKEASLEYDCVNGLANGMMPTVGDHYHPRGDLKKPVFSLIKNVYNKLQKYDEWYKKAEVLTDIALVFPHVIPQGNVPNALTGAVRMLCELKVQFDILTPCMDWNGYKTIIVPDEFTPSSEAINKINAHIKAGGNILVSGNGLLDKIRNKFAIKELGIDYIGPDSNDPSYVTVTNKMLAKNVPEMALNFYEKAVQVKPLKGTKVLAEIVAPFFNEQFDGLNYLGYQAPDKSTGMPAATMTDKSIYFSYPVFSSYFNTAPVYLKQIVGNAIDNLLPAPLLKTENLPSFARATVTAQKNRRMVHILSYVPERRGPNIDVIEETVKLRDVSISLRIDGRKISKVYLAPDKKALKFSIENGYIKTSIPEVDGYSMVVFEK